MIKNQTTLDPLAQQCRLLWEKIEWQAWPDTRTFDVIEKMAKTWAQLPPDMRRERWGQTLTSTIETLWQAAMERELREACLSTQEQTNRTKSN